MYIIEFKLKKCGDVIRWAQNPSKTFDNSFNVCKKREAKRFVSNKHAIMWLKRFNLFKMIGIEWSIVDETDHES